MSLARIIGILVIVGVVTAITGTFTAPLSYERAQKTKRNRLSLTLYWGGISLMAMAGALWLASP